MLVFVHIPKTAGTTLHKILTHQFRRIVIHHDSEGFWDNELSQRIAAADPDVVMGHCSVGLHRYLPDVRYVTCLRDPVSRLSSHYFHARNDPTHYLHDAIRNRGLDLAGYVASGLSGELSDGMTRMLAGLEDFHHAKVDEQTLATAKSNLETLFDSIILSEHFDAGLLLVAGRLGWKEPYYIRRKVGRRPPESSAPDGHSRAVIEEHNRHDRSLYEWAKERFEAESSRHPDLIERVHRFQQSNHVRGKAIFCLREIQGRMAGTIRRGGPKNPPTRPA